MKGSISSSRVAEAERLVELLSELGRRNPLRDPVAAVVEDMELTPVQLHALLWLGREGPLTMGELAARLGSSERAVTGIVDRLERGALARRVRCEEDRRVVRVRLARKGARGFRMLSTRLVTKLAAFLGLLEREDIRALFAVLERIRDVTARRLEDGPRPARAARR
jgi:DNA-binding MarR family transcriptional regulator